LSNTGKVCALVIFFEVGRKERTNISGTGGGGGGERDANASLMFILHKNNFVFLANLKRGK